MPRFLILIIIITMLLGSLIQIIPQNAVAVGPPIVTVQFDDGYDMQEAEVGLSIAGIIDIPGTVQADIRPGGAVQQIRVNLIARTDANWGASVTPPQIVLTSNERIPFTLIVAVPPRESCQTVGVVTLSGNAQTDPGATESEIEPITTTVLVEQFCSFRVSSRNSEISTTPGSRVEFDMEILNFGNGRDRFLIEVINSDDLESDGFSVKLSNEMIEIEERSEGNIQIMVNSPTGTSSLGKHDIKVMVTSENENSATPRANYIDFTINVKGHYFFFTTEFLIFLGIIVTIIVGIVILRIRKKRKRKKIK